MPSVCSNTSERGVGAHWKCERRSCGHENEWTDRLGHRPTAETKPVAPGRKNVTALGCHYNLNVCSKKLLGSKNGLFARKHARIWAPWAFALKTSVIPGAQCCLASTEVHCKGLAQLLYMKEAEKHAIVDFVCSVTNYNSDLLQRWSSIDHIAVSGHR